jgi:signal transduction histidine kinase
MHKLLSPSTHSRKLPEYGLPPWERQILALDALSKLTKRFSSHPDFQQLIEVLLMTLSGQFSVANSFAILRKPSFSTLKSSFFATGKFKTNLLLASLKITPDHRRYFLENRSVRRVRELELSSESARLAFIMAECDVALVCPLSHNEEFFGIIGLGERVTKKPYEKEDIELLTTITNTITPFVANSYLFWEVASLNSWFLDILNSVRPGVFVFDSNNQLKEINAAGVAILKTFSPQLTRMDTLYHAPLELVFPYTIFGSWAKQFIQVKSTELSTFRGSMVIRTEAAERIYNVCLSRTTEDAEMGMDLIITLDDITAQKESEQRVFELQKLADQGLLVSSISHELRNFLALILGGVEITQILLKKSDSDKAQATLDKLKENVTQMERFTAGLMESATLKSCKQFTDLNAIITDVLSFISTQNHFKHITIAHRPDPDLPSFLLDTDQITQLLLNFLNNASDAIQESGKTDGKITIRTVHDQEDAVLIISDNGNGMKPEVKEKLFTSRLTTKEKGHGFGLVACHKIIVDHAGKIETDTQIGRGTTFTIRLPIITNV